MTAPRVWAVIPARGGSKGLPRKNILDLGGKPLIAHAIDVARATDTIERIIVSTEDPEIEDVARRFGAEVPFRRPAELSSDTANVADAYTYTLDRLFEEEGDGPDVTVTLFPTHPFRTPRLLEEMIQATRRCTSAITAVPARFDTGLYWARRENGWTRLGPGPCIPAARPVGTAIVQRYLPSPLRRDPKRAAAWQARWPLGPDAAYGLTMLLEDPLLTLDIDTIEDLALAEECLRLGLINVARHESNAWRLVG